MIKNNGGYKFLFLKLISINQIVKNFAGIEGYLI